MAKTIYQKEYWIKNRSKNDFEKYILKLTDNSVLERHWKM